MVAMPAVPPPITAPITSSFLMPSRSGDPGSPGSSSTSDSPKVSHQKVCRYGRKCRRPECWFPHPEGRDIDDSKASSKAEKKSSNDEDSYCVCCKGHPYECETPQCAERGFCGCTFGDDPTEDDDHSDDDTWKDEWFPTSRHCRCCEGYIYRCKGQQPLCGGGTCFCHNDAYPHEFHEASSQVQSEEIPDEENPTAAEENAEEQ